MKASRRDFIDYVLAALVAGEFGFVRSALAAATSLPVLGPAAAFDFEWLIELARQTAAAPYRAPVVAAPEQLYQIDYDNHWKIRFRDEASLKPNGPDAPVQLFHPGRYFQEPVHVHLVENGSAREVRYRRDYFSMPPDSPARDLPEDVGFAGFRVMRPGNEADWVSFLGASYFRTDGPFKQYGLSARGLAIDTGLSHAEEFPRFSHFWLGAPEHPDETLTVWALLESPSVAGAYRFGLKRGAPGQEHVTAVASRIFMRRQVERFGIAPLTSMYWYSERDRIMGNDWRPEIHDSDGLALATGSGERIWRPLDNPHVTRTSSFYDTNPRGFGLIQRGREFEDYQDDGVFYHKRPSAWIVPAGDWGKGAVQLVEIPAVDETFDNVVCYWVPEDLPAPGTMISHDYSIHWTDRDPEPETAWVYSTRQGHGGIPGQPIPEDSNKLVIDFTGPALKGLTVDDGVEPVIEITGGTLLDPKGAWTVLGTDRWRLSFDFRASGPEPALIRAFLRRGDVALTETWLGLVRVNRAR